SFHQTLARKRAADRSLPEPLFGLGEDREGVIIGLRVPNSGGMHPKGEMVVEMEHRRKSGRSVHEMYYFPPPGSRERVILLQDHEEYNPKMVEDREDDERGVEGTVSTFELGLTAKQRKDREGVVLPYLDAQRSQGAGGPGEGGRILYEMGVEDDFDEEEDEI
ncbi:MAG: hypothetical protein Q9217_000217, partial [Psora testacea]